MPFPDALRAQRLAAGLGETEAADKLHLSVRGYKDREAGRGNVSFPERCGLLMGLGLTWDEAVSMINNNPEVSNPLSDIVHHSNTLHEDPFVVEKKKEFVLVSRQHDNLTLKILKRKLTKPEDILRYVSDASEKAWMTREHINSFVRLASRFIGFRSDLL